MAKVQKKKASNLGVEKKPINRERNRKETLKKPVGMCKVDFKRMAWSFVMKDLPK